MLRPEGCVHAGLQDSCFQRVALLLLLLQLLLLLAFGSKLVQQPQNLL
jgi:hypothetical protein